MPLTPTKLKSRSPTTVRNDMIFIEFLKRKEKLITKENSKYVTFSQPIKISCSTNDNICPNPWHVCVHLCAQRPLLSRREQSFGWFILGVESDLNEQDFCV